MIRLSILIPTYNDRCLTLVSELARQAEAIDGLQWEIVVADDVSTDQDVVKENRTINHIVHCHYIFKSVNNGRAAIRNFLVSRACGDWLLLIDGDLIVADRQLLRHYVDIIGKADIVCGGYRVMTGPKGNLRYTYEWHARKLQRADYRSRHPWENFKVSNTLFRREVLEQHPFDQRFQKYGYEDVLLGTTLREAGYTIRHIDAPVGFLRYESNRSFVSKSVEALDTLVDFHDELYAVAPMLRLADRLRQTLLARLLRKLYQTCKLNWLNNLVSDKPSLLVFRLYKIGYLLNRLSHASTSAKHED